MAIKLTDDEIRDEVVSCIQCRCTTCNTPIWVPVWDYHETKNYCYPCATTILAQPPKETNGK